MEVDEASPEIAARNSLLQLIDMIKGDSGPLVSQLKHEPSYDLDKDWEDIKQKIKNREYTTYSTLAHDLQKILDSILTASKKNIKQQRPYSLSHKNIKKQLDQYERFVRARLYEWHPGGKAAAAKEEATHRADQWSSLARVRAAELHAQSAVQLRNALAVQQRSKDANINEPIARILETSQNVTSTHAFGQDPLAVHTWLGQGLPWVSEFRPDDLLDSDDEHPEAPTMRDHVEGATAMNLENGKAVPRQEPADMAVGFRHGAAATRGGAAAAANDGVVLDDAGSTRLRAAQWKCSWLDVRLKDLSFLERQLTSMISQKEARIARELAAAEDSPYIAGKAPLRPLQPLPASASDPAKCGFSEDAVRSHAFFKECAAAVKAAHADTVVPAAEGAVQDMSDDETAPAAVYWAFASIEDNVHAFLNYLSSEGATVFQGSVQQGGGTGPATATAAPSKVPKKAPPRPRTHAHVQVPVPPSFGRRGSERKPHQRRESILPEEVRNDVTRKLEKPYVPPTRVLTPEDIAARIEVESSAEDDTSDAYYLRLHDAELAKKDEADKAGPSENRDRPHRRQNATTSAAPPGVVGRGRVAGKGPVSGATAGQLPSSATPSSTTSHTHAGPSGGLRAAQEARSTLPALVGPNGESAPAGPSVPLATTAAVGGSADRKQQPVPSFVVAAPHRFSNSPSVGGRVAGTLGSGLHRSASAPGYASILKGPTSTASARPPAQQAPGGAAAAGPLPPSAAVAAVVPSQPTVAPAAPAGDQSIPAAHVVPASQAPVAAAPSVLAARPLTAAVAGKPPATNTHGVVRTVPRTTATPPSTSAPPVPAVRPPAAAPAGSQPLRPAVLPAQPQRAPRPRPAHAPASTASPATAHMHAAVAAAAAAAASNKSAAVAAAAGGKPNGPSTGTGSSKAGPQLASTGAPAQGPAAAVVPISRAPVQGAARAASDTTAGAAVASAAPCASASSAGEDHRVQQGSVHEGAAPEKMASDVEGLRPKRQTAELNPIDNLGMQAASGMLGAPGAGSSPRKKKMRSK